MPEKEMDELLQAVGALPPQWLSHADACSVARFVQQAADAVGTGVRGDSIPLFKSAHICGLLELLLLKIIPAITSTTVTAAGLAPATTAIPVLSVGAQAPLLGAVARILQHSTVHTAPYRALLLRLLLQQLSQRPTFKGTGNAENSEDSWVWVPAVVECLGLALVLPFSTDAVVDRVEGEQSANMQALLRLRRVDRVSSESSESSESGAGDSELQNQAVAELMVCLRVSSDFIMRLPTEPNSGIGGGRSGGGSSGGGSSGGCPRSAFVEVGAQLCTVVACLRTLHLSLTAASAARALTESPGKRPSLAALSAAQQLAGLFSLHCRSLVQTAYILVNRFLPGLPKRLVRIECPTTHTRLRNRARHSHRAAAASTGGPGCV